jgi:arabinose-5-phosphate isomerase
MTAADSIPNPEPAQGGSFAAAVLGSARRILEEEGRALLAKRETLGESFVRLVARVLALRGKVGVTGVGKSGIVGEKIAATLSSTGTPTLFLKPVDALHGDLGVLRPEDYLLAISNSGETAEVLAVVEAALALGIAGVAAFTGRPGSSLARRAELTIDIGVDREACPLGLAPTASTTVTLAIGDALAMALLEQRGFTAERYALYHPGGSLGARLRHRAQDLMRRPPELPLVRAEAPLADAVREMSLRGNLGVVLLVDGEGQLCGIVTDGDLRRLLLRSLHGGPAPALDLPVASLSGGGRKPKVCEPDTPVSEALQLMEHHGITSLPVVDPSSRPIGLLHLHDILGRGKIVL